MLETIAFCAVAATWLACLFTILQVTEPGSRRSLVAMLAVLLGGAVVFLVRGHEFGLQWLRSQTLRSDAFALGALVPTLATSVGALLQPHVRARAWALPTDAVTALLTGFTGILALAIGRSGWYWEFVATIVAGALLGLVGVIGARRRTSGPNTRIAYGAIGLFGAFLMCAGLALFVAWCQLA